MHKKDLDKEHRDPILPQDTSVTDLLWPQRLQHIRHEPARDCYYTAKEAKAGDPLLVNDPAEKTTNSEDNPVDGQDKPSSDKDKDFDPNVEMEDIDKVQQDYCMTPQTQGERGSKGGRRGSQKARRKEFLM